MADLKSYIPLAGAVMSLVDGSGGIDFKTIGALLSGSGASGPKVSTTVATSNNAEAVMASTTNITVSSPGSYTGPATAEPTATIYPTSQSLSTQQNQAPTSSLPYSSLNPSMLTPAVNSLATNKSQILQGIPNEFLLIGAAVFLMMSSMGGSGKKAKAASGGE